MSIEQFRFSLIQCSPSEITRSKCGNANSNAVGRCYNIPTFRLSWVTIIEAIKQTHFSEMNSQYSWSSYEVKDGSTTALEDNLFLQTDITLAVIISVSAQSYLDNSKQAMKATVLLNTRKRFYLHHQTCLLNRFLHNFTIRTPGL